MSSTAKQAPIAIVGMGCRFPGDATSPEKLWEALIHKKSARGEIPRDRYNVDAFYHPDGDRGGATNNRGGHFLSEDIAAFDAPFFSISPAEAHAMDPMQRLLMEVVYEALENSGTPLSKIAGTSTSCYIGCFTKDYDELQMRDVEKYSKYQSTGTSKAILSNRLSYYFNLKGPSMTIDTACSSSLVAVHLACQGLRTGESETAIVGASNLIFSPDIQITMSYLHMLSPESTSYAFDDRANGYARGEGIAAVVLKRLDDAIRDNDPIRAVIRGSAINSDGKTPGITLPSQEAQISLIQSAYQAAGCEIHQTAFFEAHGTGTAAGDPIESGAIGKVFASRQHPDPNSDNIPLYIGSIKANIGHLEGASGLAGLLKAVLSVEKGIIAPNIWFAQGNPAIDFESWRIRVPTEAIEWPVTGLRRASVNSFGYGGTNAHVIVDDVAHYLNGGRASSPWSIISNGDEISKTRHRLFVLSANDENALRATATNCAKYLDRRSEIDDEELLSNLVYTLSERRSALNHISTVIADTKDELVRQLDDGPPTITQLLEKPKIGFIFTGQGAQWWSMGRELLLYPVFRASLIACDATITKLGSHWSLMDELCKSEKDSRINESAISQSLCTALQIALVDLLTSWNIHPTKVVGHSSGEIAAAYTIGALSLESAMATAFFRGALSAKVKTLGYQGCMMAVGLPEEEVEKEISELDEKYGKVVVACVNSPRSVTLSGDSSAIERVQSSLVSRGIFARKLQVDTAYHSHHMQAIAEEYLMRLNEARVVSKENAEEVTMFSSVSGTIVNLESLGAEYWVKNLVSCVRFSDALQSMCLSKLEKQSDGVDLLLEVGPHAALKGPVQQILRTVFEEKPTVQYLSALVRGTAADVSTIEAAASLFSKGYPIDLHAINFPLEPAHHLSVLTDLPPYPWNHTKKYWLESRLSRDYRFRRFPRTDILGAPFSDWNPLEPRWRNFLRLREQPWLKDHIVQGLVVFPACGYICMAIEACRQMEVILRSKDLTQYNDPDSTSHTSSKSTEYKVKEVNLSRALVIPEEDDGVEVIFSVRPCSTSNVAPLDTSSEFRVFSYTNTSGWVENCRGLVMVSHICLEDVRTQQSLVDRWSVARDACTSRVDTEDFYAKVKTSGINYGPTCQGIKDLYVPPDVLGRAVGIVEVADTQATMPKEFEYDRSIHPTTIDSLLQPGIAALSGSKLHDMKNAMVPTYIEEISILEDTSAKAGDQFNFVVTASIQGSREVAMDMCALDPVSLMPVIRLSGMKCVAINRPDTSSSKGSDHLVPKHCYKTVWEPDVNLIDRKHLEEVLQATLLPDRTTNVKDLEMLASYFIDVALREINEDEVDAMLPHHQKLYRSLRHQQAHGRPYLQDPKAATRIPALVEDYISSNTEFEGKMLVRMGAALPSILRQKADPLSLMTYDNLLEDYYTVANGVLYIYPQLARYITMLSHKYPNLDYLEIGAGTGGATTPILEALSGCRDIHSYPRLKSYTYTDISSGFFERAATKFNAWNKYMDLKKLDIETDPENQDFKPASFDVILATNVLHATSNINRTLAHIRKLLKPGGKFILLEVTNLVLSMSVIVGSLPGWWYASEEWRKDGPLLSESQWQDALRTNGFTDFEASCPDVIDIEEQGTRLMIATATQSSPNPGPIIPSLPYPILIIRPDSTTNDKGSAMAVALQAILEQVGIAMEIIVLSALKERSTSGSICVSFEEIDHPVFTDVESSTFELIQRVVEESIGILWVTRGAASTNAERPDLSMFHGLARVLRAEHEGFPCITVDLDAKHSMSAEEAAERVFMVLNDAFKPDNVTYPSDSEFSERGGILHIKRAIEHTSLNRSLAARTKSAMPPPQRQQLLQQSRPLKLNVSALNTPNSLVFDDDPVLVQPLNSDEVEINIRATGLNDRDMLVIMGELSGDYLGSECAGIITKVGSDVMNFSVGDRVAAWCLGTFSTFVRCSASCVWKIPNSMSFEIAASLPLAYVTAYYSLVCVARLTSDDKVLIHAAAGCVGQAAVQIALMSGADVFVTIDREEQKAQMIEAYGLEEDHIFSIQNLEFVSALKQVTEGRGVDVILHNISDEVLQASWQCIAPLGRYVELGEHDLQTRRPKMPLFERNATYTCVEMTQLRNQSIRVAERVFTEVMAFVKEEALREVSPILIKPWSNLEECVKSFQAGEQRGKIVLVPQAEDLVLVTQSLPEPVRFRDDASYLLAGGLGGIGRSISRWMVRNGAKNLIFVSRSGATSGDTVALIKEFKAASVQTAVLRCDISDEAGLSDALLEALKTLPPIRGVIQAAMVLNDQVFSNMSTGQFMDTVRPKVHGSRNLHTTTLNQPLDFFVMLSSAAAFIGNPGQANYAAGCTYQVALSAHRNSLNLPATAIDLGVVAKVGYVAEKAGTTLEQKLSKMRLSEIQEDDMLAIVEMAIQNPSMSHLVTGLHSTLDESHMESDLPFTARDPVLSHLDFLRPHLRAENGVKADTITVQASLSSLLGSATSMDKAKGLVQDAVIRKLARSLMMSPEDINADKSMMAYGTDSLVAVELKNWVQRETKVLISVFEIMQAPTIRALAECVAQKYQDSVRGP